MIDWLKKLAASFVCAFRGIGAVVRSERNARIQCVAGLVAVALGFWFGISVIEWCLVALACGLVLAAEALNTAVEKLADRITTDRDARIRLAKDAAAGGVLLASLAAAVVGAMIFVPKVLGR